MYIYTEGMYPCFEFWHRRKNKSKSVVWQGKCPCNVNCLFWVFLPRELMSGGELCKLIRSVSATGAMTRLHQPAAWSRRLQRNVNTQRFSHPVSLLTTRNHRHSMSQRSKHVSCCLGPRHANTADTNTANWTGWAVFQKSHTAAAG